MVNSVNLVNYSARNIMHYTKK